MLFYLPAYKGGLLSPVFLSLQLSQYFKCDKSMMVVNVQSSRLQRNNAQQKKSTAYYWFKGILSRDLDKASHIIVPVVSACSRSKCLSEWEWHKTGREVAFVSQLLCSFLLQSEVGSGWLPCSQWHCPHPLNTVDTIEPAAYLTGHVCVPWVHRAAQHFNTFHYEN